MMEMMMGPMGQLVNLRKRLTGSKNQNVRFLKLEAVGEDDSRGMELQIVALALYEVTGPASKDFPEPKQYALAVLKARPRGRHYDWWTESVKYPYQPQTYVAPEKPVEDGHDHSHPH
jgi:hypothetical protein